MADVKGMQGLLDEAKEDIEAGDQSSEYTSGQVRYDDRDAMAATHARAQRHYLSSIAKSLLVIAVAVAEEMEED